MVRKHKTFSGKGVSTDIIEASAKAYLQALNLKEIYIERNNKVDSKEI